MYCYYYYYYYYHHHHYHHHHYYYYLNVSHCFSLCVTLLKPGFYYPS